jgi:hypothetical protein
MEVLLHVEQIFKRIPIYHVGVGYKIGPLRTRFDFHPKERFAVAITGRRKVISLGKTKKNLPQILNYEKKLNKNYFLFFNDCRHYSNQILEFTDPEMVASNVVNPLNLHCLFLQASDES